MKWTFLLLLFSSVTLLLPAQELSPTELKDLTDRAMDQIYNFQDYAATIAKGEYSVKTRMTSMKLCLRHFADTAIIEEQSKNSSYKKEWTPRQYLEKLFNRGGSQTPVIMEFEVMEELCPKSLKPQQNADGSVTYKGKMTFKQAYCKLKPVAERREPTELDLNGNCAYSDTTIKEVGVELVMRKTVKGKFWIVLLSYIRVLDVY